METLFMASYVAKPNGSNLPLTSDAFYDQYGRSGWTLASLASALGVVAAWAGLLSLVPTA